MHHAGGFTVSKPPAGISRVRVLSSIIDGIRSEVCLGKLNHSTPHWSCVKKRLVLALRVPILKISAFSSILLVIPCRQSLTLRYHNGCLRESEICSALWSMSPASPCGGSRILSFSGAILRAATRPQFLHMQGGVDHLYCLSWLT